MKLFKDSPDFPDSFMKRLQEGKLVFFCGAGISMSSGLPNFKQLTRKLHDYYEYGKSSGDKRYDYDLMLDELERKHPHLRKKVREILLPEAEVDDLALENHKNLLRLSAIQGEDGTSTNHRLVTTNYDDRFLQAARYRAAVLNAVEDYFDHRFLGVTDCAPQLPMPDDKNWASLVYLHGRITEDDQTLASMVLTSTDFGRAYLIDGWARRFIVQLLREWHVVFVGYGINDPHMRYLMNAADTIRQRNPDAFRESYALVSCLEGQDDKVKAEWRGKGISTPIPYTTTEHEDAHKILREALGELANFKEAPIRYRENIALATPGKTPHDRDERERIIWALQDFATAKAFADRVLFPVKEGDEIFILWLDTFKKAGLFGLDKFAPINAFYCPPHCAQRFPMLPPVADHLALWVAKHVHQPRLLRWLVDVGGTPHPQFIRNTISFVNVAGPEKISEEYAEMWHIYIQYNLAPPYCGIMLQELLGNKSPTVKFNVEKQILAYLRPKPKIITVLDLSQWFPADKNPHGVAVDIGCELDRAFDRAYACKSFKIKHARTNEFVMAHIDTLSSYLEDVAFMMHHYGISTLDIRCFRPEEDEHYNDSHWLFLAMLVRNAVLCMIKRQELSMLAKFVSRWLDSEHLLLRRLALFAITEASDADGSSECLHADLGAQMMIKFPDILWSLESMRESRRFLRKMGMKVSAPLLYKLEEAILGGPPRSKYRDDIAEDDIAKSMREKVAVLLAKLELSGARLSPKSIDILKDARADEPGVKFERFMEYYASKPTVEWKDPESEQDGMQKEDVPKWASMTAEECADCIESAEHPISRFLVAEDIGKAIEAFGILAKRKFWNGKEWYALLKSFGRDEDLSDEIAMPLLRLIKVIPDKLALSLDDSYIRVIQILSRTQPFSKIEKVWRFAWNLGWDPRPSISGDSVDALTVAINNGHGKLAEVPLICLSRKGEEDRSLGALEEILASDNPAHEHGKIAIARSLSRLFHAYKEWATRHLMPFLNPDHPMAFKMWDTFLYDLGISFDFLVALKPWLLHYLRGVENFRNRTSGLVSIFIVGCQHYPSVFSKEERRRIGQKMTPEYIKCMCQYMEGTLRKDNDADSAKIWREQIAPLMRDIWPDRNWGTDASSISHALAEMIVLTGDAFPDAFEWAKDSLAPIKVWGIGGIDSLLMHLSGVPGDTQSISIRFPQETLFFLYRIVPEENVIRPYRLGKTLDNIKDAKPELARRREFIRLRQIASK